MSGRKLGNGCKLQPVVLTICAINTLHIIRVHQRTITITALTTYGVWNLDFFRTLLPKTCLKITTLTTLALDFAVAIYPLVLVIFTYILIELHTRGYRLVMWLWRPFHKCFVCFNRAWDIQSSFIKAFATFLLLSYVKLRNVTFDLIVYVRV